MFCSGCGQPVAPGQPVCSQCGRPVAIPVPPVPNMAFQLESYANKVKALSIVWFIWAGLSLAFGFLGMAFANAALSGHFPFWMNGPWGNGSWPQDAPMWMMPAILRLAWVAIALRTALAAIAAWGLWERTQWGRVVAVVVAFLSLLKFPFGTALGIWTLVVLLGYRNSSLYEQISTSNI